jgi:hypothetical protein
VNFEWPLNVRIEGSHQKLTNWITPDHDREVYPRHPFVMRWGVFLGLDRLKGNSEYFTASRAFASASSCVSPSDGASTNQNSRNTSDLHNASESFSDRDIISAGFSRVFSPRMRLGIGARRFLPRDPLEASAFIAHR